MVVHNPVADSFVVAHILVEDSLVEDKLAGDILAVDHIPAESNLVGHIPGEDNPAAAHIPVADKSARDSPVVVDSPVVAAHNPAVLCSVADIVAFLLAADNFAAEDSSFGFVRAAAVLLPVVRNTCKSAPRPATAGNNVYNA